MTEAFTTQGAILIAGPTASGKSALAMALAERLGGEIVNADSMQVYAPMRVLTARPDARDEAAVPHHLYGMLAADARCSAGRWAVMAAKVIEEIEGRSHVPIIVGGTGLYFKALSEGLSPIPQVPDEVRAAARADVAEAGPRAHDLLAALDPDLAQSIRPSDPQRIARGIEVARATGRPLSAWQKEPPEPLIEGRIARIVLAPERAWLHERCDRRFALMVGAGALDEAAAMARLDVDPMLPAMKALGLRPLIAHLAGETSLEEAVAAGKAETRRYAKRQETWFRTQMIAWNAFFEQDSESLKAKIFSFIDDFGLTRS
ncbi:MAG: tRNA (adenosine(37)-N6)-dimethylallyltransferase MiaA [Rhizobiales bacterium]|nr:tRNA (adenosine(37)-N6)-dimethylallyltransferase MiaA [Hyphomicrobiales bacterium]